MVRRNSMGDAADKEPRKPPPKPRKRKPPMPERQKERARIARAKMADHWTVAGFIAERGADGREHYDCPFRDEDKDDWWFLIAEALGTVSLSVKRYCLDALADMLDERWNGQEQNWEVIPDELNTALAIMAACEPQNEAQAALAMQMVTLHFSGMRLAKSNSSYKWGGNERSLATQARLAKTMAGLQMSLAKLQGKLAPRQVHQTIQVIYLDQRDQRQQTAVVGGEAISGGQGHAPPDCNQTLTHQGRIGHAAGSSTDARCPALPSPRSDNGATMLLASGEGQASLQDARWFAWIRRAFGRA